MRKAMSATIGIAVMPVSYTCRATEIGRRRRGCGRLARRRGSDAAEEGQPPGEVTRGVDRPATDGGEQPGFVPAAGAGTASGSAALSVSSTRRS